MAALLCVFEVGSQSKSKPNSLSTGAPTRVSLVRGRAYTNLCLFRKRRVGGLGRATANNREDAEMRAAMLWSCLCSATSESPHNERLSCVVTLQRPAQSPELWWPRDTGLALITAPWSLIVSCCWLSIKWHRTGSMLLQVDWLYRIDAVHALTTHFDVNMSISLICFWTQIHFDLSTCQRVRVNRALLFCFGLSQLCHCE